MSPTVAEILETAKALSREERAEVTQALMATLDEHDVSESTSMEALRAAIDRGVADLDAGKGIEVRPTALRDYVRERGRLATERAAAKTA